MDNLRTCAIARSLVERFSCCLQQQDTDDGVQPIPVLYTANAPKPKKSLTRMEIVILLQGNTFVFCFFLFFFLIFYSVIHVILLMLLYYYIKRYRRFG